MKNTLDRIHTALIAASAAFLAVIGTSAVFAQPVLDETVESAAEVSDTVSPAAPLHGVADILLRHLVLPEASDEIEDGISSDASLCADGEADLLASSFSGGSGTEADPYLLSSVKDLSNFSVYVNAGVPKYVSACYLLTNDIDLKNMEWISVGHYTDDSGYAVAFSGTFDGGGHTVSNLSIHSPDNRYTGFFGLIYNASVRNLTIENVSISYEYSGYVYSGALIGRFVAADGKKHDVTNCHVRVGSGSGIDIENVNRPLYGGGLIGYVTAENAKIDVSDCSSDIDGNYRIYGVNNSDNGRMIIRSGGLIGYLASSRGAVRVKNCYASGAVFSDIANVTGTLSDSVHNGGLIGYAGANASGTIDIDHAHSFGVLRSSAYGETYTGGFLGYAIADSAAVVSVSDCHTSGSLYFESTSFACYAAGFATIAATQNSGVLTMTDTYADCDMYELFSRETEAAGYVAYYVGTVTFENCYSFESAVMHVGKTVAPVETVLTDDKRTVFDSYGFDGDLWTISDNGYPYPTLIGAPTVPERRIWYFFGEDCYNCRSFAYGTTVTPDAKDAPDGGIYEFDCFTLLDGDVSLACGTFDLTKDVFVFANFSERYKSFTITFLRDDGTAIDTASVPYGDAVVFPDVDPPKGNDYFRYEFDCWTDSADGGNTVDPQNTVVTGDAVYYIHFKAVDIGIWDGESTSSFTGGSGTEADPYRITNGAQLAHIGEILDTIDADTYFVLAADIDLGGHEWTPIGSPETPFSGHFDGSGYGISSFTVTEDTRYAGIFGYARNAAFHDLEVTGFEITLTREIGEIDAGGVVAYLYADHGDALIERCFTNGVIDVTAHIVRAGGLCGVAEEQEAERQTLNIRDCYSNTDIVGTANDNASASVIIGGIGGHYVSHACGTRGVDRCYYRGDLTANGGTTNIAGIIGAPHDSPAWTESGGGKLSAAAEGTIRNCFADCTITVNSTSYSSYSGAIYAATGGEYVSVMNCYKTDRSTVGGKEYTDDVGVIDADTLLDETYLRDKLGFDFDAVWMMKDGYPVLRSLYAPRELYKIDEAEFDADAGTLDVTLRVCRRDGKPYTLLAAAYDERGKMIRFEVCAVDQSDEIRTLQIAFEKLDGVKTATVSLVDDTLTLLEKPILFE